MNWPIAVLVGLDQALNAVLGGYPDETISCRAARACRDGKAWGKWMCKALDLIDPGHCQDSLDSERNGHHRHPENRGCGQDG